MTVNIYRGPTGADFDTVTGEGTVRDICGDLDWDNTVIVAGGRIVDRDYRPAADDVVSVRTFPGGASTTVGKVMYATATILTGGLYAAADGITRAATGKSIGEHIISAILKSDSDSTSNTAASPSAAESIPTMKGASNTNGYGKPIPLVLGQSLFTPMYHGRPYTTIGGTDGEDQYYQCMYVLGYSDIDVKDIRLNNITVATNREGVTDGYVKNDSGRSEYDSNIQIEIRQGARELDLYPQKTVQEDLSVELMHPEGAGALEVDRFSAVNPHVIEIELSMNSLYRYGDSGEMESASVEVAIAVSFDGGASYEPFGRIGGSDGYTTAGTYGVSTITRKRNRNMRFVATRTLTRAEALSCVEKGDGTAFLRIERRDTQGTDSRVSDTVYLTAIRTKCFDRKRTQEAASGIVAQRPVEERRRDITTRMAVRIKADDNLSQSLNELNMILTSKCRTWDGAKWSDGRSVTANPAAVALMVMQSPMLGKNAYPDDMIDMEAFGRLYEFCESQTYTDAGGRTTRFAFTCGGVLTAQKKLGEIVDTVLGTCKAMRTLSGGKYSVLIDEPRTVPVTVLNNHNMLADGLENTKSFDNLPDGYKVKFVDKDNGYTDGEFYCMYDGKDYTDAVTESIELPLVTDYRQAYKLARYELAKRKLRPEVWVRRVGLEGAVIEIGSLVSLQDETILVGIGDGGEILDVIADAEAVTAIVTDSAFPVSDADLDYAVRISHFDLERGRSFEVRRVRIDRAGLHSTLVFETPISLDEAVVPVIGDFVSFGVYGKETADALCFGKKQDADGTYTLTLIPYAEGVYTADTSAIPEYDSKVTDMRPIPGVQDIPPEFATKDDMRGVQSDVDGMISGGSTRVTEPDNVTGLRAVAGEAGISVSWAALPGGGLSNSVKCFEVEVSRDGGVTWGETYRPSGNSVEHVFDRETDGYPEREDLASWRVRCRAQNIYGLYSAEWTGPVAVDTGSYGTWRPAAPARARAIAQRDTVTLTWETEQEKYYGSGKYFEIRRNGALLADNITGSSYTYKFDREAGEYPEAQDFGGGEWRFTVTACNESTRTVEGNRAESAALAWDLSDYGTWEVRPPVVSQKVTDRTAVLTIAQPARADGKAVYGDIRYHLRIKRLENERDGERIPADTTWYAPAASSDPYTSEDNYRDEAREYAETRGETYVQILPLYGQGKDGQGTNRVNTRYMYDLRAENEVMRTRWLSEEAEGVTVIAMFTSLRDYVKANVTAKEEFVESLSAISANLGEITDGSLVGDANNYWTLSTKDNPQSPKDFKGAFRVGGKDQYFMVTPQVKDGTREVTGYQVDLRAGTINFTGITNTDGTNAGMGTYIYDQNDNRNRMALTHRGIVIQRSDDGWQTVRDVAQFVTDELGNIVVTNAEDKAGVPQVITEIPADRVVYHFDRGSAADTDSKGGNALSLVCNGNVTEAEDRALVSDGAVFDAGDWSRGGCIRRDMDDGAKEGGSIMFFTDSSYLLLNGRYVALDGEHEDMEDFVDIMNKNIPEGLNFKFAWEGWE